MLFETLRQCAEEQRTITYLEREQITNINRQNPRPQTYLLENVLLPHGLPRLDALVVGTDTRTPGDGFWRDEPDLGRDEKMLRWIKMRDEAFAYDWSTIEVER